MIDGWKEGWFDGRRWVEQPLDHHCWGSKLGVYRRFPCKRDRVLYGRLGFAVQYHMIKAEVIHHLNCDDIIVLQLLVIVLA